VPRDVRSFAFVKLIENGAAVDRTDARVNAVSVFETVDVFVLPDSRFVNKETCVISSNYEGKYNHTYDA